MVLVSHPGLDWLILEVLGQDFTAPVVSGAFHMINDATD